jgi:uncharacterized protein (DUF2147 family)
MTKTQRFTFGKILFVVSAFFSSMSVYAQSGDKIVGVWENTERKMTITIYRADNGYFYGKDSTGKLLLHKLEYDTETQSYKGKITPPDRDLSLDVTVHFETAEKLKLVAKRFLISKTIFLVKSN